MQEARRLEWRAGGGFATIGGMATRAVDPESNDAIAERLIRLRLALREDHPGESAQAFAERMGITPTSWANYEAGFRPSLDNALKLCRKASVSLDWIYRGIDVTLPLYLVRKLEKVSVPQKGKKRA